MSPGPSAARLEGEDPDQDDSVDAPGAGHGVYSKQDEASDQDGDSGGDDDQSFNDEKSAASHSSSETASESEMPDGNLDNSEIPKSRGLVTLPNVDDEAVGPIIDPAKSISIEEQSSFIHRSALENLAGRGSSFSSTRTLEERLSSLSAESFTTGASKVSADMVYRTSGGQTDAIGKICSRL